MTQPQKKSPLSEGNPFAKAISPGPSRGNAYEPGTPWWWLERLIQRLMDRMARYDTLEDYALGHHPLPNGDYRYVKALQDLQKKSRTNYCELVIRATTERMKVKGFRFGPVGEADEEAKRIWDYNDMDFQSPMNINTSATFGFCYALVSPPNPRDPDSEPSICIEDPRMCIVERDPYKQTRSIAGLKLWNDDVLEQVVAMLYLPDYVYTFAARKYHQETVDQDAFLTKQLSSTPDAAGFELVLVQFNDLGEVPLVEGRWQPAFGDLGRAEHENVLDIQDRINHTVLDRLIIAKSQAYRQRWATGIQTPKGRKGQRRPPFDPGADMLWVTADPDANFGDFDTADISQLLEAVRDDVGDMAAISQTPAGYLLNKMVNVSGDTLTKEQTALVTKTKNRMEALGWFYERVMKLAFKYKGQEDKYKSTEASTLWTDPEIRSMAELADAAGKWIAAGVPLQLVMEKMNFTPDEISFAIKERGRLLQEQQQREDMIAEREAENAKAQSELDNKHAIAQQRAKPKPSAAKATKKTK